MRSAQDCKVGEFSMFRMNTIALVPIAIGVVFVAQTALALAFVS